MASILNSLVGLDNNSDSDQENLTASTAATKKMSEATQNNTSKQRRTNR